MAVERIRKNNQGVGNRHWKAYQFKEALTDPMTWLFVLYALLSDVSLTTSSRYTCLP